MSNLRRLFKILACISLNLCRVKSCHPEFISGSGGMGDLSIPHLDDSVNNGRFMDDRVMACD
jgi:hypothetical protein